MIRSALGLRRTHPKAGIRAGSGVGDLGDQDKYQPIGLCLTRGGHCTPRRMELEPILTDTKGHHESI